MTAALKCANKTNKHQILETKPWIGAVALTSIKVSGVSKHGRVERRMVQLSCFFQRQDRSTSTEDAKIRRRKISILHCWRESFRKKTGPGAFLAFFRSASSKKICYPKMRMWNAGPTEIQPQKRSQGIHGAQISWLENCGSEALKPFATLWTTVMMPTVFQMTFPKLSEPIMTAILDRDKVRWTVGIVPLWYHWGRFLQFAIHLSYCWRRRYPYVYNCLHCLW